MKLFGLPSSQGHAYPLAVEQLPATDLTLALKSKWNSGKMRNHNDNTGTGSIRVGRSQRCQHPFHLGCVPLILTLLEDFPEIKLKTENDLSSVLLESQNNMFGEPLAELCWSVLSSFPSFFTVNFNQEPL